MTGAKIGEFRWAPRRILPQWVTLEGKGMGVEFGEALEKEQGTPDSILVLWMRATSDGLSMPMTILWALEKLYGADESWTSKEVFNSACQSVFLFSGSLSDRLAYQQEVMKSDVFEEIFHRLPEVKKLNVSRFLTIWFSF